MLLKECNTANRHVFTLVFTLKFVFFYFIRQVALAVGIQDLLYTCTCSWLFLGKFEYTAMFCEIVLKEDNFKDYFASFEKKSFQSGVHFFYAPPP